VIDQKLAYSIAVIKTGRCCEATSLGKVGVKKTQLIDNGVG
jgi:hypothetical protein